MHNQHLPHALYQESGCDAFSIALEKETRVMVDKQEVKKARCIN
jgi:hypothetical protein